VCRYLLWKPHQTIDDTLTFLRTRISSTNEEKAAGYLIFSRTTGQLLGDVGGSLPSPGTTMIFGYCFARDAWGRGYATEAVRKFVQTAFEEPRVWRVEARCDLENGASARVLEKAGLELECVQRRSMVLPNLSDVPRDLWCYAKVREMAAD
jgi:RimJ/RimL family protein N-acetyltransferase